MLVICKRGLTELDNLVIMTFQVQLRVEILQRDTWVSGQILANFD